MLILGSAGGSRAQPSGLVSTTGTHPRAPACRVTAYDIEGNTVLPSERFGFLTNYTGPAVDLSRLKAGLGEIQLLYRNIG